MKKLIFQKKILTVLVVFLLSFLTFHFAMAGSWKVETLDSLGVVGRNSSLALDSNNKVHIAYYSSVNNSLKYATNRSGIWTKTTIENIGEDPGVGGISIAVDAGNAPHICYRIAADKVKYATSTFLGTWATEEIDTGEEDCSIAIDSNGNLYISYGGGANNHLKLASKSPGLGDWTETEINTDTPKDVSLTVDSNNNLHIVYYDNKSLKYTTNVFGSWSSGIVASGLADEGAINSIAIDSDNKAHIAYFDFAFNKNKYSTNASGSWLSEDIGAGALPSIAVNNNKVYVAYYDKGLRYANKNSGWWESEIIDNNGDTGWMPSLKMNDDGKSFISYFDFDNGDLKYAVSIPDVEVSQDDGIYSKIQNVSLSSDYKAVIYYTLDGTTPTTNSHKYSTPIKIKKPLVLKFFARDSIGDQSEIQTKQYIITPTPSLYQADSIINYQNGKVRIYNNKGKYTGRSFYPFGKRYKGPAVFLTIGDPDNDQKGELVASTRSKIKILTKSGKTKYTIKTKSYRVKVADINMDGKEEILVAWKNKLKIYSRRKQIASLKLNHWIKDFTVARLSNPEKPNLVIATWDDRVAVYNYQNKKFKLKTTKDYSLITLQTIDIDNSGLDKLAVRKNNKIQIINSKFKTLYTIKKSGILTVADLNKDNKLEIVLNSGNNRFLSFQKSGKSFKKIKSYRLKKGFNFGGRF